MSKPTHHLRIGRFFSSSLIVAGLCVPALSFGQDIPANPQTSTRPITQPSIAKVIIEQAVFNASTCEPADLERNISIRQLRLTRFASGGATDRTALSQELQASLTQAGQTLLGLREPSESQNKLSLCQLREVASALTRQYQEQTGQIVSRVIIPAQDITDGALELQLLEGRLESFSVSSSDDSSKNKQARTVEAVEALLGGGLGQPIPADDLERALILAGEMTGQQLGGSLRPGEQVMGTVLEVEAQSLPRLQGGLSLDNYGSAATGKHQVGASVSLGDALVFGDRVSASYFTSQDQSAISSYSLSYDMPVGLSGWRAGWRSTRTQYALPGEFSVTQARGDARSNGPFVSYAVDRTLNSRADLLLGYNVVDLRDSSTIIENQRSAGVLWSELRGVGRDATGLNSWGVGLTLGKLSYESAILKLLDVTGPKREGAYRILSYDFKRQQFLTREFDGVFSLRGQASSKNLDSYHKISLGGVNGVRAFASGEVSGDIGQIVRFELGYSPSWLQGNRFSIFHDRGSVRIDKSPLAVNASSNTVHLAGNGVQWEASFGNGIRLRVFAAKPAGGDRALSSVDNKSTRVGADMSYAF